MTTRWRAIRDTALDRTIHGSFDHGGFEPHARGFRAADVEVDARGKRFLVMYRDDNCRDDYRSNEAALEPLPRRRVTDVSGAGGRAGAQPSSAAGRRCAARVPAARRNQSLRALNSVADDASGVEKVAPQQLPSALRN
jgi:hypothetical protein